MKSNKNSVILIGVCLGISVIAMIFSAINTALAAVQAEFSATVVQLQWVMNAFGIAMCSALVVFSRLADIYGRKRIYLIGLVGNLIAMLGAGLAPSIGWLFVFQALLGLSTAIVLPVSQALIANIYPQEEQGRAIGIWAAVVGIAMAAGPLLSGFFISVLTWRWLYLFSIPFTIASFIVVAYIAPESKNNESSKKIDYFGSVLLAFTISCLVLAITEGHNWPTLIIGCLYGLTAVGLITLLKVESKAAEPIIRKDLFTNRMFVLASFSNFAIIFFVWSAFFLMPLYLQTEHHYTAFAAGLVMLLATIPLSIFSFIGGNLYKVYGPKPLILLGFIFFTASAVLQFYFGVQTHFLIIGLSTLCFGIGWGLSWGPTTTAALTTLSEQHAGIAAGSFITIQEIGGNFGLAVTLAVVNSRTDFMTGYSAGVWSLLAISLVGVALALGMKVGNKVNELN